MVEVILFAVLGCSGYPKKASAEEIIKELLKDEKSPRKSNTCEVCRKN